MIIEINKDIEKYQENIVMGLTIKQLFCSILSLIIGGGIVLLLYPRIGLTISCYVTVPIVAPIALGGFYQHNDMGFHEIVRRYLKSVFCNKPILYISTEYKDDMTEQKIMHQTEQRKAHRNKYKKGD